MPELHTSVSESSLLRSPIASQGEGGALGEEEARRRGNTVGIRDNAMDIAKLNGLKVSRAVDNLFPTPNTMDMLPARDPSKIDKSKGGHANVRETVVNELLGTPRTSSANGSTQKQIDAGAPKARIEDQVHLLPTVTTQDGKNNAGPSQFDRNTKPLNVEVVLMPTLRASDGYERRNQKTMDKIANEGGDMTMPTLARTTTNWGRFEPAIRRWEEALGRPAPAPTKV